EEFGVESKSTREVSSMNMHRTDMYLIPLESWEGAENCPVDGIGIGRLIKEGSGVESKSSSIDTSLIIEANPMDIHCVATYLILFEGWEGAEHCPIDRIRIGHLAGEGSGIES